MANKLLNDIVFRFKKYNYKVVQSRESVEYSMESKDKTKFVEIISSLGGFYCVMFGFHSTYSAYAPKSIDISEQNDLNKIDEFFKNKK